VTESSALNPTAAFPPEPHALGQSTALSGGESAKQRSVSVMRSGGVVLN
jgi:hypothetical protein